MSNDISETKPFNPHILRQMRQEAGLSLEELAAAAGLHDKSQISRYESGATIPKADTLSKLLQVLKPRPALLLRLFNLNETD